MIEIDRINHIGQAVPEIEPQAALLEGLFGFKRVREWQDEDVAGALLAIPGRSEVQWELLQPRHDGSEIAQFIEKNRGAGIHHVAIQPAQFEAARKAVQDNRIVALPSSRDAWFDATMDPAQTPEGLVFRFSATGDGCGDEATPPVEAIKPPSDSLGIVAVDHLCHAYPDRDLLAGWYERVLGMKEVWRTPDGEHDDLADLVLEVPGGQMKWEVIQPVGEGSFIERFLDTRGRTAHHVTFEVADWDAALAACERAGVPTFDPNEGETDGARWNDAFIHPKHAGGMLVQLFWEERPDVWVRSDKVPSRA